MVKSNRIVSLKKEEEENHYVFYLHEKKLDFLNGTIVLINLGKMSNATKA